MQIQFKRLPHGEGIELPAYQTEYSAGMDVRAATEATIAPGERVLIKTGFCMAVPPGYEAQMRPRSGLALKNGVTVLNTPGTIDADYRGEVGVILINHGSVPFDVNRGDRVAQMVIAETVKCAVHEVSELEDTARGSGGFGSTGVSGNKTP